MTALKPELPIDVRGNLVIDAPTGRQLALKAAGSRLHLIVPGWPELQRLGPRSLLSQRRGLAAAARSLHKLRLTLNIEVDGQRILKLGAGAKTSILARLLGLASTDIRWSTVISLLKSRAGQ